MLAYNSYMLNTDLADPSADSYITELEADAYFALGLAAEAWAAVPVKEGALRSAAVWLNSIPWVGECCSAGRFLSWPRQGADCNCQTATCEMLPPQIKAAQAELALQLGTNPGALIGVGGSDQSSKGAIQSQTLGGLSQSFYAPTETATVLSGNAPLVLRTFPWLVDLLGCWADQSKLTKGNSRILARVRS